MEYNEEYIVAYLEGRLTKAETCEFEKRVAESSELRKQMYNLRFLYEMSRSLGSHDYFHTDRHWMELSKRIRKPKKHRMLFMRWTWVVAASIALLIAGYYSYHYFATGADLMDDIANLEQPTTASKRVQLILSDGQKINIEEEKSHFRYDSKGHLSVNSEKLDIQPEAKQNSEKEQTGRYNQIVVPPGKQVNLMLSDGTKVWVNANSRIAYPVVFNKKQRYVYINGEVFLDVHPDAKHPFIVKTDRMNIRVLGTSFNVTAFKDAPTTSVVLVTGKVGVRTADNKKEELLPNQLLQYGEDGKMKKQTVDDVNRYIGWKDGYLCFNHESFSVVLDKLAHYYGKTITYTPEAGKLYCSGTLRLADDLDELLTNLCYTVPVQVEHNTENIKIDVKP